MLLNTDDAPGIWLFNRLQERIGNGIIMVSVDELLHASRFCCGFKNGKPFFSILLQRGLELTDDNCHRFLNRVRYLPFNHIGKYKTEDQSYVTQELGAIYTFLLAIMPHGLFNNATGAGLNGRQRSHLEWMVLANKAGLDTIELLYEHKAFHYKEFGYDSNTITILVFNDKCFGKNISEYSLLQKSCKRLAMLSEEKIIELYVRKAEDRFEFLGANLMPTFHGAGEDFLSELKTLL